MEGVGIFVAEPEGRYFGGCVVEVVDVDKENDGADVSGASGDSGVEEIVAVESERVDVNKLGELQSIRAKYREIDGKVEENVRLQASTFSDLVDGKALEFLSLNPRADVSVDAGSPYHKRLLIDSAQKRGSRLQRLSFDIKLQKEKRALFKQLTPAKKDELKKDEDVLLDPFWPLTEDDVEMVADALSSSTRYDL